MTYHTNDHMNRPPFNKRGGARKRLYGLVRRVNGVLYGYVDASICSMGWSKEAIYLWDVPPYHYLTDNCFIVRIHSKTCPIVVDYKKRHPDRTRNHRFTTKVQ